MVSIDLLKDDKWKDYNGTSPLNSVFNKFHPICLAIEDQINQHTFPKTFKKGKFLVSPVDRNSHLYLIVKGVVRGFVKDDKHEITTWIAPEGQIVGSIKNLYIENASEEYLQALEDVDSVAIPHSLSDYLYENFPEANVLGRKIMEVYYRNAEERAYISRIPTAKRRYLRFLASYPTLVNRVSLKFIASFLGIRLETLSRIRSKI